MSVIALDRLDPAAIALAGGKATGLAALLAAGLPVPDGFVITTDAYRAVVAAHGLGARIEQSLSAPAPDVARLFADAALPGDLEVAIREAYQALGSGEDALVAVRSSATAEDLPTASFAGQQDTLLGVRGVEAVIAAVRRCWASLWNSHAVDYRRRAGLDTGDVALAVVVQVLVDADASGVLFTADPIDGRRDRIIVDATFGLGEALVGGVVTPDHAVLDARTLATLDYTVAEKLVITTRTPTGTTLSALPTLRRHDRVLTDEDLVELATFGLDAQRHAGRPMDLEWARADGRLWVVQGRPITALPPDLGGMEWSREMMIERYPDPVTPLTWSILSSSFFASLAATVRTLGGEVRSDAPLVRLINGRVYVNVTAFNEAMASMPARPPVTSSDAPAARRRPVAMLGSLPAMVRLVLRTHREWDAALPAYEAAARASVDVASLDADGFVALHRSDGELLAPMLDNHARAIVAGDLTLQLLTALCRSWLGDADGSLVLTLLSGLSGNVTVQTNHDLWLIAEFVRASPDVASGLASGLSVGDLTKLPGGGEFSRRLTTFLDAYGHRSPRYELRQPAWREDPEQVLGLLRLMLDGVPDPLDGQRQASERRERATVEAQRRLGFVRRAVFDRVLALAQTYFRLRENQQFYLMLPTPRLRALVAEIGRRAVSRGLIDAPGDVFFVDAGEVDALALGTSGDLRDVVAGRRAEFDRAHGLAGPVRLGGRASEPSGATDELRGIAGSAGRASGRTRIVRGPDDFASVRPGDVIVAPATTPAWTPLFGVASGLITEHGGLLSHSGVVAREYGLPAVLGVPDALARIADGVRVEVDGLAGTVRLLADRPGGL